MGGTFRIEVVVLAATTTVELIWCSNFQHLDAGRLHETQQPRVVAARAFDADALQIAERTHPAEHQAIPMSGRGEPLDTENTIPVIDDCEFR